MRSELNSIPGIGKVKNPNFLFLILLVFFTIDNAVNYFVDVPIFIPAAMLLLPFIWLSFFRFKKKQVFLFIFTAIFIVTSVFNNLLYDFNKSSIADLTLILLFATSYYYYRQFQSALSIRTLHIFLIVSLLMYGFTFLGIDSASHLKNDRHLKNLELVGISFDSLISQGKPIDEFQHDFPDSVNVDSLIKEKLKKFFPDQSGIDTLTNIGIGVIPGIKIKKEPLDKIEKGRKYHNGWFRIPHVAAYFLGFLSLFYLSLFLQKRSKIYLIIFALLTILIFHNGVRTYIVAVALSIMIWFFIKRNLWYFVGFLAIISGIIIFRFEIYDLSKNTVFVPLSSLLITLIDNPDRLSRVALYLSWAHEIRDFSWYDFLVGKNFYQSQMANLKNLFIPTWYHNDFLSVFFSYGVIATGAYVLFFIKIYRDYSALIKNDVLLFVFYFTMIFTALINGLYYYFPVFLLFIFFMMTTNPKTLKTE